MTRRDCAILRMTLAVGLLGSGLVGVAHYHRTGDRGHVNNGATASCFDCQCAHHHHSSGQMPQNPDDPDCEVCKLIAQLVSADPASDGPTYGALDVQFTALAADLIAESSTAVSYQSRAPPSPAGV